MFFTQKNENFASFAAHRQLVSWPELNNLTLSGVYNPSFSPTYLSFGGGGKYLLGHLPPAIPFGSCT